MRSPRDRGTTMTNKKNPKEGWFWLPQVQSFHRALKNTIPKKPLKTSWLSFAFKDNKINPLYKKVQRLNYPTHLHNEILTM